MGKTEHEEEAKPDLFATEKEVEEKTTQHTAALCLALFCVAIGVPLWWKTTEVYRVSLPYSDIQHLSDSNIQALTQIEVIWAVTSKKDNSLYTDLAFQLNRRLGPKRLEKSTLEPHYQVSVREAKKEELVAINKVTDVSQLHNVLPSNVLSEYHIIITDPSSIFKQPLLAAYNNVFLPYNNADCEALSAQVAQLLLDVVRESAVLKGLEAAQGLKLQRPDKDTMRSFRFHSGYDVTFTLMVPEPDKVKPTWDIRGGIRDYFQPLVSSLEAYINISTTSQVLYFSDIGGKPKKGDGFFYLHEKDLPHIINPLESRLGSHASNNPGMNFITYIPTQSKKPLYIQDKNDQKVPSNSFLSPRWGGVLIYNVDQTDTTNKEVALDMKQLMEVFTTQFRLLLNINAQMITSELQVIRPGTASLLQWELAGWLRLRCVENLATATNTVQSLAQLLEEIGNIVINDEIGKEVETAVAYIKQSKVFLNGGQLEAAFQASKAALDASELAFFHPSLLELLYFPEDQKFAIYIPLFLPISIPVIASVLPAVKWFRERRKVKTE